MVRMETPENEALILVLDKPHPPVHTLAVYTECRGWSVKYYRLRPQDT